MDYTNLNDACPKDSFSLPRIVQIIDSMFVNKMFSLYHEIPMFHLDQEKMTFITPHGHCYNIMLLGLKNEGATY